MSQLEMIENFGLEKVGEWIISENKSVKHLLHMKGIDFLIPKELSKERNIVYSFLVNGSVFYVGETTVGMKLRFSGYRYGNPVESDTDNRIKISITNALEDGDKVEIWYCQPVAKYELKNSEVIEMPASKPIEEYLIEYYKPQLNVKNLNSKS